MSYPDFATRLAPTVSLERAGAIYVILTERTPAPIDAELLDRLAEPLTPADWEALAGEPLERLHLALLERGLGGSKRLEQRDGLFDSAACVLIAVLAASRPHLLKARTVTSARAAEIARVAFLLRKVD